MLCGPAPGARLPRAAVLQRCAGRGTHEMERIERCTRDAHGMRPCRHPRPSPSPLTSFLSRRAACLVSPRLAAAPTRLLLPGLGRDRVEYDYMFSQWCRIMCTTQACAPVPVTAGCYYEAAGNAVPRQPNAPAWPQPGPSSALASPPPRGAPVAAVPPRGAQLAPVLGGVLGGGRRCGARWRRTCCCAIRVPSRCRSVLRP